MNLDEWEELAVLELNKEGNVSPTEGEIAIEVNELMGIENYKTNGERRRSSYKSIEDQLDMLWHTIDSEEPLDKTSDFYLHRKRIKTKFPKPLT
tara:strand:+ start:1456 stop:1737 length:282 start_codon:yes stop_codon:yes gene_type:complete